MRTFIMASVFTLFLFGNFSSGQTEQKARESLQDRYKIFQVGLFNVQPGVGLPPDFAVDLPSVIAKQFKESKKFEEVLLQGETASQGNKPILLVSGTITDFDKGSRAKRYLAGGYGAGNARLFVTVDYADASDGRVLYEDKVAGTLSSGLFGGDTHQVLNELAKTLVANTKMVLLRPVPEPGSIQLTDATVPCVAETSDSQVVSISAHDLTGAQKRLNDLAGAGYRLTDFRITGNNSAKVTMEKCATPPQTYQYLLVHALSVGNVQKNLDKGAADGYRVSPHTLAPLSGFALIMEKPANPAQTRYEYRFRTSHRESNAEKNVVGDQAQGFTLVESGDLMGYHVVIMEKQN